MSADGSTIAGADHLNETWGPFINRNPTVPPTAADMILNAPEEEDPLPVNDDGTVALLWLDGATALVTGGRIASQLTNVNEITVSGDGWVLAYTLWQQPGVWLRRLS